ncbi:type IV secretion system protein [uncultured Ruegeria sp.]|uniref:type IV secretion system protein n=1 Tax=uncultured Ruegeria sp. TaxID=259304 RepID=UPI00261391CC|nr:type IV secretion system protein [uncultured Ruegeria sp.]
MHQRQFIKTLSTVAILGLAPTPSWAAGVPVVDATNLTQSAQNFALEIEEMARQFEQMLEQYQKLEEQRVLLESQFEAITGLTDLAEFSDRAFLDLPDAGAALDHALDAASNQASDLPEVAADAIARQSSTLGLDQGILQEFNTSDVSARRILSERGSAGLVASALGENGYDMASSLSQDAESLRGNLGQQEDLKAAIDYNTAVLLKLLQVEIETLRATSANAMATGTGLAATAADQTTLNNYVGETAQ